MLSTLVLAAALAAPSPEEVTADLARVGARARPVEYVFLLDTSQALEATSESLRPDIARLVEVAPVGDAVTILTFHARHFAVLPRTVIDAAGRPALAEKVRTMDFAAGYDRDLGDGLHGLAEHLGQAATPDFVYVFGVSNFCHAPTVTSAWSSGGRGCSTIRNQARIGELLAPLRESSRVRAVWFPVSVKDAPADPAGAAAAVHEVGGELVTDGPNAWLQNFAARLVGERARAAATADTKDAGFTLEVVSPPDEGGVVEVELRPTARVLELELTEVVVTGATGAVPAHLGLAEPARLHLQMEPPPTPWSLFPREDSVKVKLTVSGEGQLGPASAIHLWGMSGRRSRLEAQTLVDVPRRYGLPLPAALGLLAVIFVGAGFGAVLVRGRMMPLRLGGTFSARFRGGARQALAIAELAEAAIVLEPEGRARIGKREDAAIVLRVRRPVWRLYGEVQIRVPDAEINGRKVSPGTHQVVPGATSIRTGEWRLTWE